MSHRRENPRSVPHSAWKGVGTPGCSDPACTRRRWRVCGRPGCLKSDSYGDWGELKRRSASD